jgi:hypothetical protein
MKTSDWNRSESKFVLCTLPATENILSDDAEVAGMAKMRLAKLKILGHLVFKLWSVEVQISPSSLTSKSYSLLRLPILLMKYNNSLVIKFFSTVSSLTSVKVSPKNLQLHIHNGNKYIHMNRN